MTTLTDRLADLASGVLLDAAQVVGVSDLPARFVRVKLAAEAFRKAAWAPGTKLQLRTRRGGMALRTYTPVDWDPARGEVDLIGFTHAGGPGAEWFRQVAVGDTCQVLGPRRSIDLRDLAGAVVFVGDESSVALARALDSATSNASYVFEARDPAGLVQVKGKAYWAEGRTGLD